MNSNVESGILAFLTEQLGAVDVAHGAGENKITITRAIVGGKHAQLLAATGDASIAEPLAKICVKSDGAKIDASDATVQLWLTTLEIVVATPRRSPDYDEAAHRAFTAAVRAAIIAANQSDIADALSGFGISACNSWFFAGAPDQHTAGHWITLLRYDPFGFTVTL